MPPPIHPIYKDPPKNLLPPSTLFSSTLLLPSSYPHSWQSFTTSSFRIFCKLLGTASLLRPYCCPTSQHLNSLHLSTRCFFNDFKQYPLTVPLFYHRNYVRPLLDVFNLLSFFFYTLFNPSRHEQITRT